MNRHHKPAFASPCDMRSGADYVEPTAPLEQSAVDAVREWHERRIVALSRPLSMEAFDRAESARSLALAACEALLRSYGYAI